MPTKAIPEQVGLAMPFNQDINHVDAYLDVMIRRYLNDCATNPVDFNYEGWRIAKEQLNLGPDDTVLDVGTSSGVFTLVGAKKAGLESTIIGLDPYIAPHRLFLPLFNDGVRGGSIQAPLIDPDQLRFMNGRGEAIPLPDSSVKAVAAHNVLFRATNVYQMLDEMKRVTEPDGLILISTNAKDHAKIRHGFERRLAVRIGRLLGRQFEPMTPPASSCYAEDMPDIIAESGGLEMIDELAVCQDCPAVITEGDRLEFFIHSLMLSANRISDEERVHLAWRRELTSYLMPLIHKLLRPPRTAKMRDITNDQPYFTDTVRRKLFVLRNVKA